MNQYVEQFGEEGGEQESENPFEKSLLNYLENLKNGNG